MIVKSTYCSRQYAAALCIHYFPPHLPVILAPNEITHKSPKVLTTQALRPEKPILSGLHLDSRVEGGRKVGVTVVLSLLFFPVATV